MCKYNAYIYLFCLMKYNFINCHECEVYDHQVEFFMHCSSVKFHCEFKKLYFTIMVLPKQDNFRESIKCLVGKKRGERGL